MSSLVPMAAGTHWKVRTLLLRAEDGRKGVGWGVPGRGGEEAAR